MTSSASLHTLPAPAQIEWLTLSQAAQRLSIHVATLRRWANQGLIQHMVTPGGHRRFALSDLERFAAEHKAAVAIGSTGAPEAWAARAMSTARESMPSPSNAHWLAVMTDETREQHRQVGRKLMALTLQYLSADDGEHLLGDARHVGREYGQLSKSSGITLADALQAALFFRDKLLEASLDLPDTTRPHHSDQRKLLKRINTLLNTVQIAIAEVYELPTPGGPALSKADPAISGAQTPSASARSVRPTKRSVTTAPTAPSARVALPLKP